MTIIVIMIIVTILSLITDDPDDSAVITDDDDTVFELTVTFLPLISSSKPPKTSAYFNSEAWKILLISLYFHYIHLLKNTFICTDGDFGVRLPKTYDNPPIQPIHSTHPIHPKWYEDDFSIEDLI